MNVLNKVTLKFLNKNRSRTVVTIIGIILSTALICAVTTTISSFQDYLYNNMVYMGGDWHGSAESCNKEVYEGIAKSDEVETAVYSTEIGYARVDDSENVYKPYLYIIGTNDNFYNTMPVHLTKGEYPKSEEEILLPEHYIKNTDKYYNIGDVITLEVGRRTLDGVQLNQKNPCYTYDDTSVEVLENDELIEDSKSITYKVVGFYERPSFEEYTAPGYTAITKAPMNLDASAKYDVYFKLTNAKNVYDFMSENQLEGKTNSDLLMASGVSRFESFYTVLYGLAAIVIILIMFGSISLIYNAFSISVAERTKQFGLLSSIGATKKQIKRMVLFEAISVSAVGIPLGILLGIGGIGVTLKLIGGKFNSALGTSVEMKLCISAAAIVIACVVALLTVLISAIIPSRRATKINAIDAIRQNSDIKTKKTEFKSSKLIYKIFGFPGMIADKYYKRNAKRYRATVLSMFMSIVLFISASSFCNYLMESVSGGFRHSEYDVLLSVENDNIKDITLDSLLEKIKDENTVTNATYAFSSNFSGIVDKSTLSAEMLSEFENQEILDEITEEEINPVAKENEVEINPNLMFVRDEDFESLISDNGLSESKYMQSDSPLGVVLDYSMNFDSKKQKYVSQKVFSQNSFDMNIFSLKDFDDYYIVEDGTNNFVYINEKDKNDTFTLRGKDDYDFYPVKVGDVIEKAPYFIYSNEVIVIYPYSAIEKVLPSLNENISIEYYIISSDHKVTYDAVKQLTDDFKIKGSYISDYAETMESSRNIVTIIQVFSYGFIILISLIAAANVFNTISTNIMLRRREFAMLRSVGMTERAFRGMMNFECLLYGAKALIYGLPTSAVVTALIYSTISEAFTTTFKLPWLEIGIAILSVFVIVFATMLYSMSKIKKENTIDALKNDNL